jgi:hypothetical protein
MSLLNDAVMEYRLGGLESAGLLYIIGELDKLIMLGGVVVFQKI